LGVRSDGVKGVDASLGGVAAVRVALVSLVARGGGVSDLAVVVAVIDRIDDALNGIASSLSRAIGSNFTGNLARAKIRVDLSTGGGIARITSAGGVGLDGVGNLGAGSLSTVTRGITVIGVAFVGSCTLRGTRRRDDVALAARTRDLGVQANVAGIATIRCNTVTLAIAETTARSVAGSSGNGLASLFDETSDQAGQLAPVTSGKDLRRLVLGNDQELRIGINSTDTNCVDENTRNEGLDVLHCSSKIVVQISNTQSLGLIFVTGNTVFVLVKFSVDLVLGISLRRLSRPDKERRDDFVVVTIGKDDQDRGCRLSNAVGSDGSVSLSFQHLTTVDNTARDTSSATAASTRTHRRTGRNNTLRIGVALKSIGSGNYVGL
jgi:hypothetical protein